MNTQKLLTWPQIPMNEYKCQCGLTSSPFEACPNCEALHLSQSASDTAKPLPQNLEAWLDEHTPDISAYWKSKEGRCLACGLDIAVQEQYCPKCESFLLEMHAQQESDRLRTEVEL
jgi:hypothetical protein